MAVSGVRSSWLSDDRSSRWMACERRSAAASRRACSSASPSMARASERVASSSSSSVSPGGGVAGRQVGHQHRPALGVAEGDRREVGLDEAGAGVAGSSAEDALGPPPGTASSSRSRRGRRSSPSCMQPGAPARRPARSARRPRPRRAPGSAPASDAPGRPPPGRGRPASRASPRSDSRMRLRRETSASSRSRSMADAT